jgi:hypothetical protein
MCRINIAHTIRHHISTISLLACLGIEPLETYYYHRRLLRLASHISRLPLNRCRVCSLANPRPLGCPQMTWCRALKKSLSSNCPPADFAAWRKLAAEKCAWRQVSAGGQLARHQTLPRTCRLSGRSSGMAPRKPNENELILRQANAQSAQPAQAGGTAGANQKHALALLLVLLRLFAQCKTH